MEAVILQWGAALLAAFSTALAAYLFRGKEELVKQVNKNTHEILNLKSQQKGDRDLLSQKMASVEAELRDLKESVRDDVSDIKNSVNTITRSMTQLAEAQGELRGTIMTTLKNNV